MATYKVLQDIEAEDKLLGPLTLKQFIFAAITIGLGFIGFTIITSGAPSVIKAPLLTVLFPPLLLFGFLAAPISRDQPNDIWLLARLRFLLKPHRRIWNQDGLSQLVTITAPKREVHTYTDGLSQVEVKSRLQALANTVDSRGWAVKNVNTNLFAQPSYLSDNSTSDRLIDPSSLQQSTIVADVHAADDMLDPVNNSTAQHLDQLMQESSKSHRQQAITQMQNPAPSTQTPQDYWFMNQTAPQASVPKDYAVFDNQQVVAPGTEDTLPAVEATPEEEALAEKLVQEQSRASSHVSDHMKVLQPLHDRDGKIVTRPATPAADQPSTDEPPASSQSAAQNDPKKADDRRQDAVNPAILGLAHNDDLNVATIARQAKRISEDDGEVVISLH